MKKIQKYTNSFLLAIIVIIGCSKDFEILDTFNFKVDIKAQPEGYVYEPSEWTGTIIPERQVTGTTYSFSFENITGDGTFEIETPSDIQKVSPNTRVKIPVEESDNIVFKPKYLPTTVGDHEVKIIITNSNGVVNSQNVKYKVTQSPFTFLLQPNANIYLINTPRPVTVSILKTDEKEGEKYKLKYVISGGTGKLYNDQEIIPVGQKYEISGGVHQLQYIPTSLGKHTIVMDLTAIDDATRNQKADLKVENVGFTINATATATSINLKEELPITINLNEVDPSADITYSLTHEYNNQSTTGIIKNHTDTPITPGVWEKITPGTYKYLFKSEKAGTSKIIFKAKDNNGQIRKDSLEVKIENVSFKFTAIPSKKEVQINKLTPFNFNLTPNSNQGNNTYTLIYEGKEGNGLLYNGSELIQPGTPISIAQGTFSYNYKPTSLGSHALTFKVTDNSGEERTAEIQVNAVNLPTTFNVTAANQSAIGKRTPVTFTITPQGNSSATYEMNYFLSGGTGVLENDNNPITPGTFNKVNTGTFSYHFTPTAAGNFVFEFQLRNSNGEFLSKKATIVVTNDNSDYIFSGASQQNTIHIGGDTDINFDITETVISNADYEMKYAISEGEGIITNANNPINAGQYYPVNIGAFSRNFKASKVGKVKMLFTVRNKATLVEKVQEIALNVTAADFSFTVTPTNNNQNVNTPTSINFNVNQIGNGEIRYNMIFTTSKVGTLLYNGNSYTAGQVIPFEAGASSGTYIGSVPGDHNIKFTVTNNNVPPVNQTANVTVNYLAMDFKVTASGDGKIAQNSQKDFNIMLSETVKNSTSGYEVRYSYTSGTTGTGEVLNGTTPFILGEFYPIALGNTTRSFKGLTSGIVKLLMEVKNNSGTIRSSIITFEITNIPFTFNATPQNNGIFLGESTNINMNINETARNGVTYKMRYEINGAGTGDILVNGNTLQPGVYQPVNTGAFSWQFKGLTIGKANIKLYAENSTGVHVTKDVSIEVKVPTFDYSSSSDITEIVPNTDHVINHFINNLQGDQTLEYSFNVLEGNGQMKRNNILQTPNTWYAINSNEFNNTVFNASNTSNSNVRIEFKVRNNHGVIKTSQVSLKSLYAEITNIVTSLPEYLPGNAPSGVNGRRGSVKVCLKAAPGVTNLKIISVKNSIVHYNGNYINNYTIDTHCHQGTYCFPEGIKIEVTFSNGKIVKQTRNVDVWKGKPSSTVCK